MPDVEAPPYTVQLPVKPGRGLAIAAFIVGLGSILFCWLPFVGIPIGITGVVLGIVALACKQSKAFSILGIIAGALTIVISIAVTALIISQIDFDEPLTTTHEESLEGEPPRPAQVEIPDLVGMEAGKAEAKLSELGLVVELDAGGETVSKKSDWRVAGMDPRNGQKVEEGSTVILHLEPKPDLEATAEPNPAPTPDSDVKKMERALAEVFGVDTLAEAKNQPGVEPDNPMFAITEWEAMGSSTVRLHVQASLTKSEAKTLGVRVFNLIGPKFPKLDTLVVRGADGLDHNVFRRDAPLADG